MNTFMFMWRPIDGGDWYEQSWEGKNLHHALARFTDFWGYTPESCHAFLITNNREAFPSL